MPYGSGALLDFQFGESTPMLNIIESPAPAQPASMRWWLDPMHPNQPGYFTSADPGTGIAPIFTGTAGQAAAASAAAAQPPPVVNPLDLSGASYLMVGGQKQPLDFFSKAGADLVAAANKVANPFTKQRVTAPMTNQMGGGGVNPFHAYGEQW